MDKVSSKCKLNIYERKVYTREFFSDLRPLRKKCPKVSMYYDKPASSKCKAMHACVDAYDNSRQLHTFALRQVPRKEVSTYYYLDVNKRQVVLLKKWHDKIDYSRVYYGTMSNARKKLEKLA